MPRIVADKRAGRILEVNHVERLMGIFMPYFAEKRAIAKIAGQRFVHYTTADAAVKMLKNEEVWLRKSSVMNDFSEIEFGLGCLSQAWNAPSGVRLKQMLEDMLGGSVASIDAKFNEQLPNIRFDTYLTCISEHDPEEDSFGRLSMWRAYGNVAVVLSPDVFMAESAGLMPAYSNPVNYHTRESFQQQFDSFVDVFAREFDYLKARGTTLIWEWMVWMMRQTVLCTKHRGFREEREWRIIHSPTVPPSPIIRKDIEVIRGVAQPVMKLKLQNSEDGTIRGLDIPSFVQRIIIGPTQYPNAQLEAFAAVLESKGVTTPYERIFVSDIPLRQ